MDEMETKLRRLKVRRPSLELRARIFGADEESRSEPQHRRSSATPRTSLPRIPLAWAAALAILIWALPLTTLGGHSRQVLLAKNRQKQLLFSQLAGMAVTLAATPYQEGNFDDR